MDISLKFLILKFYKEKQRFGQGVPMKSEETFYKLNHMAKNLFLLAKPWFIEEENGWRKMFAFRLKIGLISIEKSSTKFISNDKKETNLQNSSDV